MGPILFLYYEESLVSSNVNSKVLWFHSVRPNLHPNLMSFLLVSHGKFKGHFDSSSPSTPTPNCRRSLWMTPIVKPERPEAIAPVAYPEIQITETLAFDQILDKVVSKDKRPNKD